MNIEFSAVVGAEAPTYSTVCRGPSPVRYGSSMYLDELGIRFACLAFFFVFLGWQVEVVSDSTVYSQRRI